MSFHLDGLAYKCDHENGGASHDLLVAVPIDQIAGELETEDLSDVRSIGD